MVSKDYLLRQALWYISKNQQTIGSFIYGRLNNDLVNERKVYIYNLFSHCFDFAEPSVKNGPIIQSKYYANQI